MNSWLEVNDAEMYSAHNEEKSAAAERFIRILNNKIYNIWLQYKKICILVNYMMYSRIK